jgi:hypothetical protein
MDPEAPPDPAYASRGQLGVHNASVDQRRRDLGACAQVHLPTGRMCTMRQGHEASCDFVEATKVDASLERRRTVEGW